MKILDSLWFTGGTGTGCIGIVRTSDEYSGVQYFIGIGQGLNQDFDESEIADWGSRFPTNVGDLLFGVK